MPYLPPVSSSADMHKTPVTAPTLGSKLTTGQGGVEHGASAIEDSLVVDVFTPCREDYIP